MDLSEIEISFSYGAGAERTEILRNVRTILTTPLGTCPLYREFGLDTACLDEPVNLAQNLFAAAAMEAIERWEPRVTVTEAALGADADGHLKAKVVIANESDYEIGL